MFWSSKLTCSHPHVLTHLVWLPWPRSGPNISEMLCSNPSWAPWLTLLLVCLWRWSENPPTVVLIVSSFKETLESNKQPRRLKKVDHKEVKCAGRACGGGGWVCVGSICPFKIQRGSKLIFFSIFHGCCFINRKLWDVQRIQGAKLPAALNFNDRCIP